MRIQGVNPYGPSQVQLRLQQVFELCEGIEGAGDVDGRLVAIWVFPKIGVPQNGWFMMENPIKMDDLGVPLFSETSICG